MRLVKQSESVVMNDANDFLSLLGVESVSPHLMESVKVSQNKSCVVFGWADSLLNGVTLKRARRCARTTVSHALDFALSKESTGFVR